MINDYIPDNELIKLVEMYEKARDYKFPGTRVQQPSLFSHEQQEYSGLDINTYIYIADNYEKLKERLDGRKRSHQSRQKTVY